MKIVQGVYTYNIKEKKQARILKKIRKHKFVKNLYVVVLPLFHDGLLEIYPYNQLLQDYYKKIDAKICVVGFAMTHEDAESLVLQIVQDLYDSTGDAFDIRKFFMI